MEDYYVRYGCDGVCLGRTDYLTKAKAEKFYDNLKLDENITWKELWYEPIDEDDEQYLLKEDEVQVFDYGMFGKLVLPKQTK